MAYHITGLDPAQFSALHALDDAALAQRGVKRVRVEEKPGAPCRITLDDAEVGEHVLLLSYEHQPAATPYRQQGPIFVREASRRCVAEGAIPPALAGRTLSLRGFDAEGMMKAGEVCPGVGAGAVIERFFADPAVAYIHAHYAGRGCFAALISRV